MSLHTPPPTLTEIDVVIPTIFSIGFIMTGFRLADRIRHDRFGWDDVFCILSICNAIAGLVFFFISIQPPEGIAPPELILTFYGGQLSFLGTVWSVRISLLLTIVRFATVRTHKLVLVALGVVFFIFYLVLVGQVLWICETEADWKEAARPECWLGMQATSTRLCCDVISDLVLLVGPLRLLSKAALERSARRRLLILFSTCLVLTVLSVCHDILVSFGADLRETFVSMLEVALAPSICSITVVVTCLYRMWNPNDSSTRAGSSMNKSRKSMGTSFGGNTTSVQQEVVIERDSPYQLSALKEVFDKYHASSQPSFIDITAEDPTYPASALREEAEWDRARALPSFIDVESQ